MKGVLRTIALSCLCLAFVLAASASAAPRRGGLAAWVVRDRLTSPEAVAAVVQEAREAGIDTLVVQVRGRGDAYYKTCLAPRAEALASAPPDFDPLAEVLKKAKGLRVIAWLNVYFVWSGDKFPRDDAHVFWSDEDWILEDRDGREVWDYSPRERALGWLEGIYVDPASPKYRAYFADLAAEVAAKYSVDGIHLDFVRYPGSGYGKGGPLGEEFENTWGFDPRWIPEELETPSPFSLLAGTSSPSTRALATASFLWKDLRAGQVTQLVRAVRRKLRAGRRKVELSAAVFPRPGDAYSDKGQDWLTWASQGLVEALYPMAYFGGAERVGAQLREMGEVLKSRAPRVRLWAGLGGYIKDPDQIGREARSAWSAGCRGVCLFDLGTMAGKPGGVKAYAEAVRRAQKGARPDKMPRVARVPERVGPSAPLVEALDRASGGRIEWGRAERRAADRLWREFEAARRASIPEVASSLEGSICPGPEWVDLRGVFRYVSPGDGEDRRLAQRRTAEEALARLQAGEDMALVARETSQGGSRELGGVLARRYVDAGDPILSLSPGQFSPVVATEAGYWVYKLEARGGGEVGPVAEMPWPARRVLFRSALRAVMDPETRVSKAPTLVEPPGLSR